MSVLKMGQGVAVIQSSKASRGTASPSLFPPLPFPPHLTLSLRTRYWGGPKAKIWGGTALALQGVVRNVPASPAMTVSAVMPIEWSWYLQDTAQQGGQGRAAQVRVVSARHDKKVCRQVSETAGGAAVWQLVRHAKMMIVANGQSRCKSSGAMGWTRMSLVSR